jgi:hypothetical protein
MKKVKAVKAVKKQGGAAIRAISTVLVSLRGVI